MSRSTFASFADALGNSASALSILSHDWSASAIGAIESWQRTLKTTVSTVVRCPAPMALLWGEDGILLYNDGYAEVLGDKHPGALGRPIGDVWPDAADFNFAVVRKVGAGESLRYRDQFFVLERDGRSQRCWFDLDYSPVFDDTTVVGVLALVHEKTRLMLVSRQLELEREQFVERFLQTPTFMALLSGPEHRFERINPGYAQLIGHRDVVGKTVAEALPEAVEQGYLSMLDDTFRSGDARSAVSARYAVQAVPGGPVDNRFLDFVYQPIKDAEGVVTGIFVEGVDMTERETAAALKRESDTRNRQILNSAVDYAIVAFDPDGRVTQWNEGARRMLGWTEEEVLGRDGACFFMPEDLASGRMQMEMDMRRALAGDAGTDERWHLRKSGERFWGSGEMTPLRNEDGAPVGFVKVLRDVTERKAAEQAFQESAAQFRILAQALPSQVWTAAPNGRLDWVNTQFSDYCGAVATGAGGAAWTSLVHPGDAPQATAQWDSCVATGAPYEAEFRLRGKNGAYRWHLVRALPLQTASGPTRQWIGTATDIHERRLQEAQNTRDLNRIWSLSQEVMLVCDFQGRIAAVNPAATRCLGWAAQDMVGKVLGDFLHPDDLEATAAEVQKLGQGVTTLAFENRYLGRDGGYRLLSWTAVPDGGMIHAVARDITRERATENALRQSQKLEAIGQLTGGVAHDFNNVLAVMRSAIDLLRLVNLTDERRRRYMDAISDAVTRATKLTAQLLAFARRQALQPVVFDARRNLEMVSEMIGSLTGVRIKRDMQLPDHPCFVYADPSQFDTAIVNLAVNARDAMDGSGTLTVSVQCVSGIPSGGVTPAAAGGFVAVSVSDTGVGIPAQHLTQIFEPFFTTKGTGQGTGLGLSQVFGFARQSGGEILVDSTVGAGTTFTLYLPRSTQPGPEADAAPRDNIVRGRGHCILVVEDNPDVAVSVEQTLEELGYATVLAASGEAALDMLARDAARFDAVFSDVVMSGISGIELGKEVQRLYPGLPVLLSSGYSYVLAKNPDHGFKLLPKPYALEDLARTLEEMMSRSRGVRPPAAGDDEAAAGDRELLRQAQLDAIGILDTEDEEAYDELTRLAAQFCNTPVALISLIDGERQWFKSRAGTALRETPREHAFCAHAIRTPQSLMLVSDAAQDARFADNPLVTGEPNIRFYAGAPLVTAAGHALGTLCVLDQVPRTLQRGQIEMLQFLANQVVERMEKRMAARKTDNGRAG